MSFKYRIVKGVGGDPSKHWTEGKPYTELKNNQYQRAYNMDEIKSMFLACKNILLEEGQYKFLRSNDLNKTMLNKTKQGRGWLFKHGN